MADGIPEPNVRYNMFCEGLFATNYRPDDGAWRTTPINFEREPAGVFGEWTVERFQDGLFRVRSGGTYFFAASHFRDVVGSPEFDPRIAMWSIESAGDGNVKIKVSDQDLVWTVKESGPEHARTLFLEPANGSPSQLFSFVRAIPHNSD